MKGEQGIKVSIYVDFVLLGYIFMFKVWPIIMFDRVNKDCLESLVKEESEYIIFFFSLK